MTKEPEALRLAAHAEANSNFGDMKSIAAELRRLHSLNQDLLAALKDLINGADPHLYWEEIKAAHAVIAKAEGDTQ